jgi:hypothetical protein
MTVPPPPQLSRQPRTNPIVRFFTSIWLGVSLLLALFTYASIMSALAPVRGALELSEMQAFSHWLFVTLAALFVLALMAVTFFRSRWRSFNAGALITHSGLLLLIGGAVLYFGTKVEGDVKLDSPRIVVRALIGESPQNVGEFLAEKGSTWSLPLGGANEALRFDVAETKSQGVLPVVSAKVRVHFGTKEFPPLELTDKPDDWQTLQSAMQVKLELHTFPPQSRFYDKEVPALFVRNLTAGTEVVCRIRGLPFHRERYLSEGPVLRDTLGREVPSKRTYPALHIFGLAIPTGWFERWRMPIDIDATGLPFHVQVTGYVPYVAGLADRPSPNSATGVVPVLEALERRLPRVGDTRGASAIRLKITGSGAYADWWQSDWCLMSPYPDDDDARPVHVKFPGSNDVWEVIYSRLPHELGATLGGQKLSVTYFPGGWDVDSYRSDFLAQADASGAPAPEAVYTNHTWTTGQWTLFQENAARDGWSWTGLGVGNRHGLWLMNMGWIMVTLGCLYAFYVKPVLLRHQRVDSVAYSARASVEPSVVDAEPVGAGRD